VLVLGASLVEAAQTPLVDVAQLSARGDHACVVTAAGGAKCWGSNSKGQLGGGPVISYPPRSAASDVVGLTSGVVSIAAATGPHTCAVMSGGGVKCWGAGESGQLGLGVIVDYVPVPMDVQGMPWPAVGITAGLGHTCAWSAAGEVACWGANSAGQLGDGTTTQRLAPAVVPGLSGVVDMSAAVYHTCAVTSAGAMKCWGANEAGQLGDGTRTGRPSPVDVSGLDNGVTSIATGGAPSPSFVFGPYSKTCAVAAGVMKCWGGGTQTGSYYGNAVPVDVAGAPSALEQITLGGSWYHTLGASGNFVVLQTCGVSSTGAARCWGTDVCGLVGTGTPPECTMAWLSSPTYFLNPSIEVVGAAANVVDVSAAAGFTCALFSGGEVKCWGGPYGSTATAAMAGRSTQAIAFQPYPAPFVAVGGSVQLSPAPTPGPSSSPVVLTSLTPATCSVSGITVTGLAGGTCTIAANQDGDAYFEPAPQVTYSFAIDPRTAQVITFQQVPASIPVGGVALVSATASTGRPVTFEPLYDWYCTITGNFVFGAGTSGLPTGTCTVIARVNGDSIYAPGEAMADITILPSTTTRALVIYSMGGGAGTITSEPAGISCATSCVGSFTDGSTVTLTATALAGSTFSGWSGDCTGTGPCMVTMGASAIKTVTAHFSSDLPRLANISTRGQVISGTNPLIAGFTISGSGSKSVLVRALGISLSPFLGFANIVTNPKVYLYASGQSYITENDDWSSGQKNLDVIRASGLQPSNGQESVIYANLPPGGYTAIVTPSFGQSGIGIVEVFELDNAQSPLINISTRGEVGDGGKVMIAGFIIQGNAPQTVAILGKGPSLAAYGITNPLSDPQLQLVRMSDGAIIASNDNWREGPRDGPDVAASGFAPSDDLEAAILVTLEPGAYTAILSGSGGRSAGTGIVEVYRVGN
jgi:hypothetical protein